MKLARNASIFILAKLSVIRPAVAFSPSKFSLNNGIKYGTLGGSLTHLTYSYATSTILSMCVKDTDSKFPSFQSEQEYEEYLKQASGLPKGFATGSAVGNFIPEEAPSMGSLPIKGTIIHLPDGPSDNWAAVFTENKVSTSIENQRKVT